MDPSKLSYLFLLGFPWFSSGGIASFHANPFGSLKIGDVPELNGVAMVPLLSSAFAISLLDSTQLTHGYPQTALPRYEPTVQSHVDQLDELISESAATKAPVDLSKVFYWFSWDVSGVST